MHPMLEQAERSVGNIGPRQIIAHVGKRATWPKVWPVSHFYLAAIIVNVWHELGPAILRHEFGAAAIVGKKQHHGVIVDAKLLQLSMTRPMD